MSKLKELRNFKENIISINEKLSDQSLAYAKGKVKDTDKHEIGITLNGQRVSIPFSADSYEPLLDLIDQEIEYLGGN